MLIDFEYAGYGDRGFDVGNHFCEWAADYHSAAPHVLDFGNYPTEAEQRRFAEAYVDECANALAAAGVASPLVSRCSSPPPGECTAAAGPASPPRSPRPDECSSASSSSMAVAITATGDARTQEAEVARLLVEARRFGLASHLHWAIWGLIQGLASQIDFDFFEYGAQRIDRYWVTKEAAFEDKK